MYDLHCLRFMNKSCVFKHILLCDFRQHTLTTYDLSSECVCLNIQASLALIRSICRPFHRPLAPFSLSLFQLDTHLNSLSNTRFFSLNTEGERGQTTHSCATVQIVSARSLFHFSSSPFFLLLTFLFFCPSLVNFYCE